MSCTASSSPLVGRPTYVDNIQAVYYMYVTDEWKQWAIADSDSE